MNEWQVLTVNFSFCKFVTAIYEDLSKLFVKLNRW
jgi:hypothetical protein